MTRIRNILQTARGVLGAAALAAAVLAAAPARAQDAPPPADAGAEAEARIPAAVLSGLLTGEPGAVLALKRFIAAEGGKPEEVTRRALGVIRQLRETRLVSDPALIMAAAERVAGAVRETLGAAKISKLRVDRNFRPPPGTVALDFGTADAAVPEGFERVLANDPRLKGRTKQAIRRPGDDDDLLSSGVIGLEGLELDLPDGEYRVTLMTEALGDAATTLSPFGQSITANGQSFSVLQSSPEAWLEQAVLSNEGLSGVERASGRTGGAVTITVRVTGGKLNLQFRQDGAEDLLKTYLTGMIVEPVEQPSVMWRPPEAEDTAPAPETRLNAEAQIASSIAGLLEEVAPASGPAEIEEELPEPVIEPTEVASPS